MEPVGGFDSMFALMQVLFFVVFTLVVGGIVVAFIRQLAHRARNATLPEVSAAAAVADKRIQTSGGGESSVTQRHFVLFEQSGGERFELEVPSQEYGILVVGDRGTVSMKGNQYLGFTRELMR